MNRVTASLIVGAVVAAVIAGARPLLTPDVDLSAEGVSTRFDPSPPTKSARMPAFQPVASSRHVAAIQGLSTEVTSMSPLPRFITGWQGSSNSAVPLTTTSSTTSAVFSSAGTTVNWPPGTIWTTTSPTISMGKTK